MFTYEVRDPNTNVLVALHAFEEALTQTQVDKLTAAYFPVMTASDLMDLRMAKSQVFGREMLNRIIKENQAWGVVGYGLTGVVFERLRDLVLLLFTGNVAAFSDLVDLVDMTNLPAHAEIFINQPRLNQLKQEVSDFLAGL